MRKLVLACATALAMTGSALGAPPSDTVATIKTYQRTNASIQAVTEAAIKRFNAKYPNVKVQTQWLPLGTWGEYISGFLNQVASRDVPDIYEVAIEGFSSIASKNLLLPLDKVISGDEKAKSLLADIDPKLLKGMSDATGGTLYFFPTSWNNVIMFYNKDMFDAAGVPYPKPGWTWQDFARTAKALTKRDASGNVTQYGYYVPGINFALSGWLVSNGTDKLKPGWKESNVTDPKFAESLKFLHDLIHVDKAAPNFDKGVGDVQFAAKQVAMFSAGHWVVPTLIEAGLKNVGVQLMPAGRSNATVYGIGGLGITRQTKNPELVWELVKEMTGPEAQRMYADTNRNIPSLRSIASTPEWTKYPENAGLFYTSIENAVPIASPPNFAEVEAIFMRHAGLYLTNNVAKEKMIADLDAELSRAMRRVR
ncbi:MAG: sugar ABC transporter substrate-binding protein [Lautropia sp.]